MNKPIILFTNFWDANHLLERRHFVFLRDKSLYKIQMHPIGGAVKSPKNYSIYSIALSHPPLNRLKNIHEEFPQLNCLNFFCPTYKLLRDYKDGGSWDDYSVNFRSLLRERKKEVSQWMKSLIPDHIYILCCWENTSNGAHCHRALIYDALSKSKSLKNRAIYAYRDGSWDGSYIDNELYAYIDQTISLKSIDIQNQTIPLTINNPYLSDQMGAPLGSQIGTFTTNNGSWNFNASEDNNDLFLTMVQELSFHHPVSIGNSNLGISDLTSFLQ
ncbi:MAG: hypothetical protein WC119_07540 [Synergistaceae bacterium]